MLYVSNNGETCKDQLCQHPECWQTNVRRVREAVRQRNGIVSKERQIDHEQRRLRLKPKKKLSNNESLSLPTLKVIDVTRNIATPFDNDSDDDVQVLIEKAPSCSTLYASPIRKAPRTTPVSPSIPERIRKNAKLKQKITCSEPDDEKTKTVSFHEIYDYEEVCQDWQETFISSAYLVWCPSTKKRETRRSRKSSATTEHKTRGYADILEHALPLPMEETPKKRRKAKYPTGGQPYSPCRSPTIKHEHFKSVDDITDGDFILTVTKEQIPKSLVTSKKIIESKAISAIKEHPHLQGRVSDSTKVLVDISSRLASSPVVNTNQPASSGSKETEIIQEEDKKNTLDTQELVQQVKPIKPKRAKTAGASQKQPSDFEPRKVLPLPSVGIPWGLIPATRQDHCKSSIPHGVELGVVMEPVVYQARSASTRGSKKKTCANVEPNEGKTLNKAGELGNLTENDDERNHLTSAYRLSPRRLLAPAPTPITPGTREGGLRRQPSDLVRLNATRSLSKTVLPEHSSPATRNQDGGDGTEKTRSRHAPQRTKSSDDHVILEVEETNRNTFHEFAADFSKMSVDGTDRAEGQNEATPASQHESADKMNDNESAISLRAVSPSSRTNIPPDIWAELRGDDDRRITPGKHLEIRQRDRVHSTVIARGYHSSLGLSVYSYIETSWKPTKLPRSFIGLRASCQGPYEQTILPRMPASLTVVPVPSITRSWPVKGVDTEPRAYHLAQSSSIRMPPVPMGSPVRTESTKSSRTAAHRESSQVRVVSEGAGPEHKDEREDPEEVEYLIARDVVTHQEVPEKVGDVEQALGVEILSVAKGDSCGSDSKDRPPEIDVMNGQDDEDGKSASVVFGERPDTLSKEAEQREACELRESVRHNEMPEEKPADGSTIETMVVAERASKEGDSLIAIEAQVSTSDNVKYSATQSSTEPKPQDSISQDSIPQDIIPQDIIPQDIVPQDIIPQDSIPQDNIPPDIIPQDSIPQDINPQGSIPKVSSSPRPSEPQAPLEDLSIDLGGTDLTHASNNSNSNLLSASFEQMLAVTSHNSLISNDSDDFQLEPFNVESELLQPIHIESDLFLLHGDSYLELSFDESELDDHP